MTRWSWEARAAPWRRQGRAGLPLAWRIVLSVAVLLVAAMLLSGYLLIENARQAIAEESRASQALARGYAIATVGSLLRAHDAATMMTLLPDHLQQPRHVRLHVIDGRDRLLLPQTSDGAAAGTRDAASSGTAPAWFGWLVRPTLTVTRLPITVAGQNYGSVVITVAPAEELEDAWTDFRDLAILAVTVCLLLLLALLIGVGRALRPLSTVSRALGTLESGDYAVRVPAVPTPDLRPLTEGFNSLAAALERAVAEKDRLNQRLVTLQDSERRQLAMELHDEVGPCLFGIKVEARGIADDLSGLQHPAAVGAAGRARSIGAIVEQLQQVNRLLLTRLRPMSLGQLPLPQVLDDLLGTLAAHGPEIAWQVAIDPELGGHDETVELTVYRVLQESVTNALRHGEPGRLEVRVGREGPDRLLVEVSDDGCGFAPGGRESGLRAMRERVEGLGGRLEVASTPGRGTRLRARIPLGRAIAGTERQEATA